MVDGNDLFYRAVFAMGMNGTASGTILIDTLVALGSSPLTVTIEELGASLMEIERRLRLLVQPDDATKTIARLRHFILRWPE